MQTRKVVILGGCGLAFGAAFANTGLVFATGTSVSHLTGDISRLSVDVAQLAPELISDAARVGAAMISFLLGATLAGIFICHPTLDLSRPYGRVITGIGALFLLASYVVSRMPLAGISLAALACGLQNALAAHYRGVVLRTTHLTGLITDFGVTLGMRLRGHVVPMWKIAVPFLLIFSFFVGGVSSGILHFHRGADPIRIAGIAYGLAGIGWSISKRMGPSESKPQSP